MRLAFVLLVFVSAYLVSCQTKEEKEKEIAVKYCSSCHTFPEPNLLPKKIWEESVLPQMAFRMGLDYSLISKVPPYDQKMVYAMLPDNPVIGQKEWEEIRNFYRRLAPDSLASNQTKINDTLSDFSVTHFKYSATPILITLLKDDSATHELIAGTRNGQLFELKKPRTLKDSLQMSSSVSYYERKGDREYWSLMGIMDPNDQARGKIQMRTGSDVKTLVDSLKRPVFFQVTDIDGDQLEDIIVCEFGNFAGQLSAFRNIGNTAYKKIALVSFPGARKFEIIDWDRDGLKDIVVLMTQGDERIMLLKNNGNFSFTNSNLLRFPSVYGSSYFELHDLNADGKQDIIYSNGDNGDYSVILKPYHGLRTFLNDGKDSFKESWFYPMPGASQFRVADFDKDGDMDIAAVSFFPNFEKYPEQGFIYFENKNGTYQAKILSEGKTGRWLVMEIADMNEDGFQDIILGSLNFSSGVPRSLINDWVAKPIDLLILENKTQKR